MTIQSQLIVTVTPTVLVQQEHPLKRGSGGKLRIDISTNPARKVGWYLPQLDGTACLQWLLPVPGGQGEAVLSLGDRQGPTLYARLQLTGYTTMFSLL